MRSAIKYLNHVAFVSFLALAAASPGGAAESVQDQAVASQLKQALVDSQKKLGQLEGWQKKVFDEEVLPQYQRFIRDYRSQGSQVAAEIDFEGLRNFLRFHASKFIPSEAGAEGRPEGKPEAKAAAKPEHRIAIYLRAEPGCGKCTAAEPVIRELVKARVERRGWTPLWLTAADVGGAGNAGKRLSEKVVDVARIKSVPSSLSIQWQLQPPDDSDDAHADEKIYSLQLLLNVRELAKAELKASVLENDRFESATARLLTDALGELGHRAFAATQDGRTARRQETLVVLSGFKDFARYSRVKAAVQAQLVALGTVEERKVARDRITLAVLSTADREEIQKQLSTIPRATLEGVEVEVP